MSISSLDFLEGRYIIDKYNRGHQLFRNFPYTGNLNIGLLRSDLEQDNDWYSCVVETPDDSIDGVSVTYSHIKQHT